MGKKSSAVAHTISVGAVSLRSSKHDPKIRVQISDLVTGVLDVFLLR
jgi:hypothetical protein